MSMNQNIGNLMKEAQKMQKKMQDAQEELTQLIVKGRAGGGLVVATMNGRHDLLSIEIDVSLLDPSKQEMTQDCVVAAINHAVREIEKESQKKIQQLTAGLNIPSDLLGQIDEEDK